MSVECPAHDGLHIFEDAFVVQIVDPETGEPLPDGQLGAICITELYKTGSPQFRYNIMDLSYLYPPRAVRVRELAAQDGAVRRPGRQHGQAARESTSGPRRVGEIALAVDGVTPDYFVRAVRGDTATSMVVDRDERADPTGFAAIA